MASRFPISFDLWYRGLSSLLLLPPADSFLELAGEEIEVRMAWAFRARLPRSAVASVREEHRGWTPSRGPWCTCRSRSPER